MNKYRTHTCGELTKLHKEKEISLSGWINKKRDHGNLLFIDLRDNFGITQCVIDKSNEIFKKIEKKLINFIISRIDRSYRKIDEFIYKIDELSLKKKKPINLKTIKEIL